MEPSHNITPFIEFFLHSLVYPARQALADIQAAPISDPSLILLPRRQEILSIIADHPNCSFDFLHRRFLTVKLSTLHYDLQQLQKQGFIHKRGTTTQWYIHWHQITKLL